MRILITGSRRWTAKATIRAAILVAIKDAGAKRSDVVLVLGDARGADADAKSIALEEGYGFDQFFAQWKVHGKAAGPIRNGKMVASGADIALAFPIGESRGTRDCIDQARAAGIPVTIYEGVPG